MDTPPEDLVTIQTASLLLDVPAATLRTWERRYGLPRPGRSIGGHRRYGTADLYALRLMRDEISRGRRATDAATAVLAELALIARPEVRAFVEAARGGDVRAMNRVLHDAAGRRGLDHAVDEVLLPAMREVGRLWDVGRCDLAQEHLATTTARQWLGSALDRSGAGGTEVARPGTGPGHVLLTCGPQEDHTLGIEALAVLLRARGHDCSVLTTRTPVDRLVDALAGRPVQAVVLVSHMTLGRRSAVAALQAAARTGVAVYYAGHAFGDPPARTGVPGSYLGTSLRRAADLVSYGLAASPAPLGAKLNKFDG